MNNNGIRAITWNLGQDYKDWHELIDVTDTKTIHVNKKNIDFTKCGGSEEQKEARRVIESKVAKVILELAPDVLFLQEVSSIDRPMLKELSEAGYDFHWFNQDLQKEANLSRPWDPGCVVALKTQGRFKALQNVSNVYFKLGKDVAIVGVTDSITQKTFAFVSAHAPGLEYRSPEIIQSEKASKGNLYCSTIKTALAYLKNKPDVVIIGIDSNASPQLHPTRFRNLVGGLVHEIQAPNERTNVLREEADTTQTGLDQFTRTLDYIITIYKEKHDWGTDTLNTTSDQAKALLSFDPSVLSSDHRPVFTIIDPNKELTVKPRNETCVVC